MSKFELMVQYLLLVAGLYFNIIHGKRLTVNLCELGGNVVVVVNYTDNLVLSCSSNQGNKTIFQWSKDDKLLTRSLSTFTAENVTEHDAAKYQCVGKNHTCSAMVHVNVAAEVLGSTYQEVAIQDDQIELSCDVSGYPQPTVKWFKYKGPKKYPAQGKPSLIKLGGQRYLMKLSVSYPSDGDIFQCEVVNDFGAASQTISYKDPHDKMCPAIFKPGEINISIVRGKPFSLICKMKDVSASSSHGYYHVVPRLTNQSHLYHIDQETRTTNYTVIHATLADAGVYNCSYNMTGLRRFCQTTGKIFHVVVKEPMLDRSKVINIHIVIIVSVCGTLAGLALVLFAVCLHKRKLKSQRFYDSSAELRWDVFVSYSSKDFVWVKHLCEILEEPPFNLVVCLHQRDWELGRTVLDNMADSVYCSYKTLLVVSTNYLESSYCMQELELALNCPHKILIIKIDDVSLKRFPKCLRLKSYLDFSNTEEQKHFEKKLLKALPRREVTENHRRSSCMTTVLDTASHIELRHITV